MLEVGPGPSSPLGSAPARQRPSSAAPQLGSCASSGRASAALAGSTLPGERPAHLAPSHGLGCSSQLEWYNGPSTHGSGWAPSGPASPWRRRRGTVELDGGTLELDGGTSWTIQATRRAGTRSLPGCATPCASSDPARRGACASCSRCRLSCRPWPGAMRRRASEARGSARRGVHVRRLTL